MKESLKQFGAREVVITGIGVISPIGVTRHAFWKSLVEGRSGIRPIQQFDASRLPVQIAGEVRDFDGKAYVRPRKNLKVMARDAQFAVASVELACEEARLNSSELGLSIEPDRFGVVFGADRIRNTIDEISDTYRACLVDGRFDFARWATAGMPASNPLIMLKNLPNMLSCHISIAKDARGPNNTICSGEVSSLLAIAEAAAVIARDQADVMIAGGAASRMHPLDWVRSCLSEELSTANDRPAGACRPFDRGRSGQIRGEGAAAFVLESRQSAERRGAPIFASVLGWGSGYDAPINRNGHPSACVSRAVQSALRSASLTPERIGHVNAHGMSTVDDDRREATALANILPDVPVFAPKSYFGNLQSSGGAVEFAASVLALQEGIVPMTLNYEAPDPTCPIRVIRGEPLHGTHPVALALNETVYGQATAVIIGAP